MAESFIIYCDYAEKFARLTDEQFGKLMRYALLYQRGEEPEINDILLGVLFDIVKLDLDRNAERYAETIEKRKEAGKAGADKRWKNGRPIAKIANAKNAMTNIANAKNDIAKIANAKSATNEMANDSTEWQGVAKMAVNVNDNDIHKNIIHSDRACAYEEPEEDQEEQPDQMAAFEEFWKIYPYKVSRITAEQAWARLNPSKELAAEIIAGVKKHRDKNESWRRDKGRYIPKPDTFLTDQRWRDELPEELPELESKEADPKTKTKPKPGSFNDFPQRDHDDDYFAELEKRKIKGG